MSERAETTTRERILAAAAAMFGEDPAARLSVRAVAARAGVSTGSLRHHFPTQHALMDAVLAQVYGWVFSGDPIRDRSLPARERLVRSLQQVVAANGAGAQARESLGTVYRTFVAPEPTDEVREAYQGIERAMRHQVEGWLAVLVDEGELRAGDDTARARFLLTVVNGLGLERALPSYDPSLTAEAATLVAAVDGVFDRQP